MRKDLIKNNTETKIIRNLKEKNISIEKIPETRKKLKKKEKARMQPMKMSEILKKLLRLNQLKLPMLRLL